MHGKRCYNVVLDLAKEAGFDPFGVVHQGNSCLAIFCSQTGDGLSPQDVVIYLVHAAVTSGEYSPRKLTNLLSALKVSQVKHLQGTTYAIFWPHLYSNPSTLEDS